MKYAVVCAGGPVTEIAELTEFRVDETVFIGADRGTLHLLEKGIIPQKRLVISILFQKKSMNKL